ncbi:hypothetical protein H8356DRAFT_1323914 [Neocallimastix lanati (nom. inval.)]|nr:hypothetical protein H8356DRAFT_1323914 [Neocallimastix sp. JGI-2020a]
MPLFRKGYKDDMKNFNIEWSYMIGEGKADYDLDDGEKCSVCGPPYMFYILYELIYGVSIAFYFAHMVIGILYQLRRSQSSLHTARRCIPNVPTYISNDHEHQNGTINSSLVYASIESVVSGESLMDITCGLMISQDRNLIR